MLTQRSNILSVFLMLGALSAQAQDPVTLKQAHEMGKKADRAALDGVLQFAHAEALYEEALELAPNDPKLNIAMGLCQLNGPQRQQALPFFKKAYDLAPATPHVAFLTGYSYQLNAEWDKAIALYEEHKRLNPNMTDPMPLYNSVDRRIRECQNGIAATAAPKHAEITNMGAGVNSQYADYGPVITADGRSLLYTSRRPENAASKVNKATKEYFEDVYASDRSDGVWTKARRIGTPVNTIGNDACVGLFNDGRTMVIYRDIEGSGDLYQSVRKGETWSEPVAFGPNVNTPGHESSAWYSFDRQWLYFVSDGFDDGVGGQDIYRSRWDAIEKEWGRAENLGPTVNTAYDEDGIFVHPDGSTIYFSSKGHNSIGGYDIFKSRLVNGAWTTPESLGWPVNSADDDLFFVLTADGSKGYFSSFRPGGFGEDDLYEVKFELNTSAGTANLLVNAGGGAPIVAPRASTVILKGKVKSFKLVNGMEANIQLVDLTDATLVGEFTSDKESGEYLIAVPAGRDYAMYVKAEGYLTHSENIPVVEGMQHLDLDFDINMEPISAGNKVTMKNLFFAFGSAALAQNSLAELNQLEELLARNATMRLEIDGHTDNTGASELNQRLSDERAKAVVDYLVQRGVKADRLQAKGFGDQFPIAPNDSSANKALNRRTEVKVL